MPQSVFARRVPGDIVINRVLQNPYVRATIANPKFTRNFDVPYGAGPNKTKDGVVNIDRHIPQIDVVNGRRYDPARPTAVHEIVEQHIADQLQEGHAHAGDQIYEMAHHAAERAERMWVEKHLGPTAWGPYQQHWAQWLAPIEHENPRNPPPNLDKYPYPHRNVHDAPRTQETEPVFARAERRIGVAPTPKFQEGGPVPATYQAGGEVEEEEPERMVAAPTLIGTSGTGAATSAAPPSMDVPEMLRKAGWKMVPSEAPSTPTSTPSSASELLRKAGWRQVPTEEDEGAAGTVLRETAHEAVPLAAGVGTSVLAGAALGAPLTPLLGPVAPIAGGIIGGIAGGAATSALQEWALKKLGLSDEEQRAVNREAHPYAALAGEAALPALFARPSAFWKAGAAGTRLMESPRVQAAAGALLGGGLEAGQEAISGQDFDPKQIAAQAASMGVFSGAPTRLGRALMGPAAAAGERLGARFGGKPAETAVPPAAEASQAAAQEAPDIKGAATPATPAGDIAARDVKPAPDTGMGGPVNTIGGSEAPPAADNRGRTPQPYGKATTLPEATARMQVLDNGIPQDQLLALQGDTQAIPAGERSAVEPPPAAEPEGISPAKLRERIEAAYLAVTQGRKAEDVPLSKIRAQLSDLDRKTVDAGLLRILQGDATARMGKINNPRAITPEEREAAFSPGGDPLHLLWMNEPAAPPTKQTVAEPEIQIGTKPTDVERAAIRGLNQGKQLKARADALGMDITELRKQTRDALPKTGDSQETLQTKQETLQRLWGEAPAQAPRFSLKKDEEATSVREERHGGSRPVYSILDKDGSVIGTVRLSRPFEHQLVIDDIKVEGGSYSGTLRKGMPLGPDALKYFLTQIPKEFPGVTMIGGSRISGARGVAGTDRRVFRKLSDLIEPTPQAGERGQIEAEAARYGGSEQAAEAIKGRIGERVTQIERGTVPERELPPERMGRVETLGLTRQQMPGGGGAGRRATRPPGAPMPAAPQQSFLQKLVRRYQETFDPETISANSRRAGPLFRTRGSVGAGERDRIYKNMEPFVERWNKLSEQEQHDFLFKVEKGEPIPPEQQADAKIIRDLLNEAHKLEVQWGSKAAFVKDYISHEWDRPKPGQAPIADHFNSLGPTWFQKARTIDFIEEGIRAGYKLKTSNPFEIVRSRLLAGAQMRTDMQLLHGLKDMGLADVVATNRQAPALVRQGWQEVNAPDRQRWMIHPDLVPLWNNSVAAKSLWSSNTAGGEAFRTWMNIKNTVVPLKLGLSGFHVLHVAHINLSSNLTRSAWQMVAGDFDGAIRSVGQAFTPYSERGVKAREQWLLGENARTEQGKRDVKFMEWGGITPMLAEEMRQKTEGKFKEAVQSMNPLKIGQSGLLKGIHAIQAPIFEQWIPHLKAADFLNNADALVTRRPELLRPENEGDLKIALSAIGKSTDNRYGEMFYSNLFWKRIIKDMGIGSFLSLGWNLGFLREFGGAALEAVTRPLGKIRPPSAERQIIRDATNKITFATIYLGTAALIGGAMTKMLSGEDPKEPYDYIFPRVGGVNPDGSPRRLNTMFYLREGPMLQKHIQEYGGGVGGILGGTGAMVWNKLLLQPLKELYENRSYYGSEIWDTNAPAYQQVAQAMKHLAIEQVSPMAYSGAMRARETGGGLGEQALAVLGFGPAPSYAARSALDNRIAHLYERFVAPGARPYEDEEVTHGKQVARNQLLMAKQRGDPQEIADATTAAREAGFTPKYLASLGKVDSMQKMFQRLPQQEQMAVLNQATPEELQRYWKYSSGKTKIEWRKTHPIEANP